VEAMSYERRVRKVNAADVRPIFRRGDRVLVKIDVVFYDMIIQRQKLIDGVLWLDGEGIGVAASFQLKSIIRRLAPNEIVEWP
jgi:hypothetical protein